MILDKLSQFADSEDFFGAAGTAKIGNAIPLGAAGPNLGEGHALHLVIGVTEAMAGGTSVQFNLVTADNAALDSNPVTLLSTPVLTTASVTLGLQALVVALPKATYKAFLGITATRVGTSTAGEIDAFLTMDPPTWRAYPEGLN